MKRREFISVLGGATIWALSAPAQPSATPTIGLLNSVSFESYADRLAAFLEGLKSSGFVESQNVKIEYRSADGHVELLDSLAAELVRQGVAVIVTFAGSSPTAARKATSSIPIVFAIGSDPIAAGLVTNLRRPEANLTGVSFFSDTLGGKRLGLLHELVPAATKIGFLVNSRLTGEPQTKVNLEDIRTAAEALRLRVEILDAATEQEIDAAFDAIKQRQIEALIVGNDGYLNSRKTQIVELCARRSIPAMYAYREHVTAGGLIAYGTDVIESYRQAGNYAARILKGEKPADLPVLQPTKFDLIINMRTAIALGITVPTSMQLLANEVID
jgi:putative ABC transport system substrate-binding protein